MTGILLFLFGNFEISLGINDEELFHNLASV